jgi:hypothetical protein
LGGKWGYPDGSRTHDLYAVDVRTSRWVVGLVLVAVGAVGVSRLVPLIPIKQRLTADSFPTAGGLVVYGGGGWTAQLAEGHTYVMPIQVKNTSRHDIDLVAFRVGSRVRVGSVEFGKTFAVVSPTAGGIGLSELTPELASRGIQLPATLGPGQDAALVISFVVPAANKSDVPVFTIRDATVDIKSGGRSGSIRVEAPTSVCARGPEALTTYDPIGCNERA